MRGTVVALATCSLADTGFDRDSKEDERRPARRAEPDPRPSPEPAPSALEPRWTGRAKPSTWTRSAGAPDALAARSAREFLLPPVIGRPVGSESPGRKARRWLLIAPKHGPPVLA